MGRTFLVLPQHNFHNLRVIFLPETGRRNPHTFGGFEVEATSKTGEHSEVFVGFCRYIGMDQVELDFVLFTWIYIYIHIFIHIIYTYIYIYIYTYTYHDI